MTQSARDAFDEAMATFDGTGLEKLGLHIEADQPLDAVVIGVEDDDWLVEAYGVTGKLASDRAPNLAMGQRVRVRLVLFNARGPRVRFELAPSASPR